MLPYLPSCLPPKPTTAPAHLPARQRTLEVIGLVKAELDLVSEAAAALANAGDPKAEAGQAGGAGLQVEVPVGAGPCRVAWEWAAAGHQQAALAPPAPPGPVCPLAVPRFGMSSRTPSGMPNTMPRAFMASQV